MIKRLLYSPFLAQIVPTRRCNLRCGYCNEYERDSEHVKYSVMLERLRKIRSLGTLAIEFSGGEPLLHPEIYKLIAFCRGLGFLRRMLITNGYLINEESIDMLNCAGLNDLQLSIDCVTPNKVTVETFEPLRKKLVALTKYAEFRVTINTVICSSPNGDVKEVVKYVGDMGFKLRACLIPGKSVPFKCRAGSRYLYVDEFGQVNWCSQTRDIFSKDLMSYSDADLKEQFYSYKQCHAHCTVACVRTTSKLDRWRSQNRKKSVDKASIG
ncbi:MAG: radical SAM protein [Deltaproteobacteria bacterium]|nr:radical SAM protein [Deltaproteobacteria bacterium]